MRLSLPMALVAVLSLVVALSAARSAHADSGLRAAERAEPAEIDWGGSLAWFGGFLDRAGGQAHFGFRATFKPRAVRAFTRVSRFALSLADPTRRLPSLDLGPLPLLTARPVEGQVSSPFGERRDPIHRRRRKQHNGLDFVARRGTPVHASAPGRVVRAKRHRGYGRVIYIAHGLGVETRYAHLETIEVAEGDFVPAGARIGSVGSSGRTTGPHLHFEVRRGGKPLDPEANGLSVAGGPPGLLGALIEFVRAARDEREVDEAPSKRRDRTPGKSKRTRERPPRERRSLRPSS